MLDPDFSGKGVLRLISNLWLTQLMSMTIQFDQLRITSTWIIS